jgi:hypothetical protein
MIRSPGKNFGFEGSFPRDIESRRTTRGAVKAQNPEKGRAIPQKPAHFFHPHAAQRAEGQGPEAEEKSPGDEDSA